MPQSHDPKTRRLAPLLENVSESGLACLLTMVQGNLLALSLTHWLVASQTGLISGALATAAVLLVRTRTRWVVSVVLGAVTTVVDYLVHPGQIGPVAGEAVITGLGAAALSWTAGAALKRIRRPTPLRAQEPAD